MKFLKIMSISVAFSTIFMTNVFAATTGVISGTDINVRSAASTEADIIKVVNSGTSFDLVSVDNNFVKTLINDEEAFISADFVNVTSIEGTVNANTVNIRKEPSVNGEIIGLYDIGDEVIAVATVNEWIQVEYNGEKSYVHKDFFVSNFTKLLKDASSETIADKSSDVVVSTFGIVQATGGLKLRDNTSLDAGVVTVIEDGAIIDVNSVDGEWVNVSYNNLTGFVNRNFIDVRTGEKPSRNANSNAGKGEQVVNYAKQFLGTPYSWAGTNLSSGVDCSGFTYAVFKNFGINLNRIASDQRNNGAKISRSDLVIGDLIFFDTSGGNNGDITHVGIYAGNGQFIHSSSGNRSGVVMSDLNSGYYNTRVVTAARVLR